MPFEPAPKPTNAWIVEFPEPARALRELVGRLRKLSPKRWHYAAISLDLGPLDRLMEGYAICGTIGCALGHSPLADRRLFWQLPDDVQKAFFYGGEGRNAYPRGWQATKEDVADRIEHWLATGEIQ